MKLSKRTNTIILWVVSIGLLAGMVVMFTPGLGSVGGTTAKGAAQITVNGQTLYDADLQQIRNNSLFNTVTEGEVGQDLQRLMVDEIVRNAVIDQAAARISVGGGQVRKAVNDFRSERGVSGARNDQAYLQLIGSAGFTDQTFRDYLKGQLRLQEWEDRLVKDVTVSDAEVRAYYDSHLTSYQTEEKIRARELVVADKELADSLRREQGARGFAQARSTRRRRLRHAGAREQSRAGRPRRCRRCGSGRDGAEAGRSARAADRGLERRLRAARRGCDGSGALQRPLLRRPGRGVRTSRLHAVR